ncbi:hypothetical protein TS65_27420 [Aneurinibacillus migulanus]|uniref:Uncharacterized protein n=1 Tax=Aneurinibacillus migulanus TaxID=47500 RepID=A0A0D1XGZ5_ANEMI|nr:hypothetical protein TS65_27420 [Aneurinibacillus migulanus]KON97566.1 hypothetical protein AF333_20975 [Aneurinibacillus migulanus]SDK11354.1 hypothetical protein SAMN04487909_13931 [Aneurinibacillus migulanus]
MNCNPNNGHVKSPLFGFFVQGNDRGTGIINSMNIHPNFKLKAVKEYLKNKEPMQIFLRMDLISRTLGRRNQINVTQRKLLGKRSNGVFLGISGH